MGFQFCAGLLIGLVVASVLWVGYIVYFEDEASSLGQRIRQWMRQKFSL